MQSCPKVDLEVNCDSHFGARQRRRRPRSPPDALSESTAASELGRAAPRGLIDIPAAAPFVFPEPWRSRAVTVSVPLFPSFPPVSGPNSAFLRQLRRVGSQGRLADAHLEPKPGTKSAIVSNRQS
ncbi:hypothetical protein AAFF_G00341320 [Aldrovandia affinis]|uniref:Uncharacterized protein n=1 Tax=Aldrovandia affinis TaxID=143900 RepID=A0AAD7SKM1_9TELE|nr:hypothetical protein AAFF_G00341320 [Aldrovandia affinis]